MLSIGSVFKEGVAAQQLHVERLLVKLEDELGVQFAPNAILALAD